MLLPPVPLKLVKSLHTAIRPKACPCIAAQPKGIYETYSQSRILGMRSYIIATTERISDIAAISPSLDHEVRDDAVKDGGDGRRVTVALLSCAICESQAFVTDQP